MLHYYSRCSQEKNYCNISLCILQQVLNHRDVIIAHLIWVSIALGLHSFSLYIHNDTLQAFGRPEDIFHDNYISSVSIQLKPDYYFKMNDKKVIRITQELGTADFIVWYQINWN